MQILYINKHNWSSLVMHSGTELKFDHVFLDILQVLKIKHTSICYLLELIVEIWLFFWPLFFSRYGEFGHFSHWKSFWIRQNQIIQVKRFHENLPPKETLSRMVKHSEKFLSVFGGHLVSMNNKNVSQEEEGYYAYSLTVWRILHLLVGTCKLEIPLS
jgi:hypothetical protein